MPSPKIFSLPVEGELYLAVENNYVYVYRFGDRTKDTDWQSRMWQKSRGIYQRPSDTDLNDWAIKQSSYGSKSENLQDNPFVSVATSSTSLFKNGEGWVQQILTETPDLGVFLVPFNCLMRSNPTKLISKSETEWLFYDGDGQLRQYLTEWKVNPYKP